MRESSKGIDAIHEGTYLHMKSFLERLSTLGDFEHIYIRPHPSFDLDSQIAPFRGFRFRLDQRVDIDWLISSASLIVGFSSVLLYYGKRLGIPTFSTLEEEESSWRTYFGIPLVS